MSYAMFHMGPVIQEIKPLWFLVQSRQFIFRLSNSAVWSQNSAPNTVNIWGLSETAPLEQHCAKSREPGARRLLGQTAAVWGQQFLQHRWTLDFPLGQVPQTGISCKGLSPATVLQSFLGQSCLGDGELCDKENPYFCEGEIMPWDAELASRKAEGTAFVCFYGSQDLTYVCQPGNLQFYFISATFWPGVSHWSIAIFAEALELAGKV